MTRHELDEGLPRRNPPLPERRQQVIQLGRGANHFVVVDGHPLLGMPRQQFLLMAFEVLGVLLEEVLSWVRSLPGSQRLRALIVFDEVYGFLPPHPQNPPTKRPLVALMKASCWKNW